MPWSDTSTRWSSIFSEAVIVVSAPAEVFPLATIVAVAPASVSALRSSVATVPSAGHAIDDIVYGKSRSCAVVGMVVGWSSGAVPVVPFGSAVAVALALADGSAVAVALPVGVGAGVDAPGKSSGFTSWSREIGPRMPDAPAWRSPVTSASAYGSAKVSLRMPSSRCSQAVADEGAFSPRMRIDAMIRGSMPSATLWSWAASSCAVRVPSSAVAAARSFALTSPPEPAGIVIGIATETPTGVCS